jgi:hypothetical protein
VQKKKGYDYIDGMKEWQDHQYNPAHFTGGKIPFHDLLPGKPFVMGIIYISIAVLIIAAILYVEIRYQADELLNDLWGIIIICAIFILYILVGIRYLKMAKQHRENRGIIKKSHKKR